MCVSKINVDNKILVQTRITILIKIHYEVGIMYTRETRGNFKDEDKELLIL